MNTSREQNELSTYYGEVANGQNSPNGTKDAAYLIYIDAVRRAVSLRFEAEMQTLRLQGEKDRAELKTSDTTFRDHLKVLFKQKTVFFTTVFTLMAAVYFGLELKTPVYEAKTKMLVSAEKQVESPYYRDVSNARNIHAGITQSEIVKSRPVLERVVNAYRLDERPIDYERQFASSLMNPLLDFKVKKFKNAVQNPEQEKFFRHKRAMDILMSNISVSPIRDTNLFRITVKDFSPQEAANIANVVSRSYLIFDIEQQLAELQTKYGDKHMAVVQIRDNIANMEKTLNGNPLSDIEAYGTASVKIIEQAYVPTEATGFSESFLFIAAFFMSVLLGLVLAFMFHYSDHTIKSPRDLEKTLNAPLLGSIPQRAFGQKLLMKGSRENDPYNRSFQNLALQTCQMIRDKNLKSLLIASSMPSKGATTLIINLGVHLANLGRRTLIIDANLRNPSMHKKFKLPEGVGFAETLQGKAGFESSLWEVSPNLNVLVAGKSEVNPYVLFDSPELRDLLAKAKEKYDIILVDCADMKSYKDAGLLSASLDGVVLMVSEGTTRRQPLKAAVQSFQWASSKLVGVILNNRTYAIPKIIYDRV